MLESILKSIFSAGTFQQMLRSATPVALAAIGGLLLAYKRQSDNYEQLAAAARTAAPAAPTAPATEAVEETQPVETEPPLPTVEIPINFDYLKGENEDIIGWIDQPSLEMTNQLMRESDLILATGGPGMVKAAYSSGKPALGVGPGNTPAVIDDSADILLAVSSVIHSKTFDNGMICAAEQRWCWLRWPPAAKRWWKTCI